MTVHVYYPSTSEAEAGKSHVQGHPGRHNKTISQKAANKKVYERTGGDLSS